MGTWVTASIFIASICWMNGDAKPQLLQVLQSQLHQYPVRYQQQGAPREAAAESYSASRFQAHGGLNPATVDYSIRNARHEQQEPVENGYSYSNSEGNYEQNAEDYQNQPSQATTYSNEDANDRYAAEEQPVDGPTGYRDHKTSQTTHYWEPRHMGRTEDEYYRENIPEHGISSLHHQEEEKHGEVHYHQHKHIHKHQHKQEHKHQHKNEHEHKHLHNQKHKHEHHSEHKHGHQHKHDHHQDHKHDHHHDHKHDHHQDHKHGHHHGHKHEHHSENKHQHHHGHKHDHKHGHEHKHKHQSKHY